MKKLAIIGGGVMASYFGEACHRLGYESHYFSLIDGKVDDSKVDVFHEINIFEKEKITDICRELGVDGVVATTELSVPITAYVAEQLGLLGISYEIAQVITDKYRNRECIKGLPELLSPKYVEATCLKDIEDSDVPFPMILKPVNLGGKRGITVVKDASELANAFDYAKDSFRKGTTPVIIAEQFLEGGIECSVESISTKGKHTIVQITKKDSSGAPHCVELGHHQPAPLTNEIWAKVVRAVSSGLTNIGVTNGPCHTEIKIINNEVYLIEFNARPGGDHIWHPMVKLSTGFDILEAVAQAATGDLKPINVESFEHHFSGLYYVVKQTGYLKAIFDRCEEEEWCIEKNYITDELIELTHNDMEHTNYIIYSSKYNDPIAECLKGKYNYQY